MSQTSDLQKLLTWLSVVPRAKLARRLGSQGLDVGQNAWVGDGPQFLFEQRADCL